MFWRTMQLRILSTGTSGTEYRTEFLARTERECSMIFLFLDKNFFRRILLQKDLGPDSSTFTMFYLYIWYADESLVNYFH